MLPSLLLALPSRQVPVSATESPELCHLPGPPLPSPEAPWEGLRWRDPRSYLPVFEMCRYSWCTSLGCGLLSARRGDLLPCGKGDHLRDRPSGLATRLPLGTVTVRHDGHFRLNRRCLELFLGARPRLDGAPVEGERDVLARQIAGDETDLDADMRLATLLIMLEGDTTILHHRPADADAVVEADELFRTILLRDLDVADTLVRVEVMDLAFFDRRDIALTSLDHDRRRCDDIGTVEVEPIV